jgi:hypothetical protein
LDCSRLGRDLYCSLRVRDLGLHAATRSARESVRRRRAPRLVRARLGCGVPPTKGRRTGLLACSSPTERLMLRTALLRGARAHCVLPPGCRQRDLAITCLRLLGLTAARGWLALRPEGAAAGAGRGWLWRAARSAVPLTSSP